MVLYAFIYRKKIVNKVKHFGKYCITSTSHSTHLMNQPNILIHDDKKFFKVCRCSLITQSRKATG